jgi:hypothetical protein
MRDTLLKALEPVSAKAAPEGSADVPPPAIGFYYLCLKKDILPAIFEETRRQSEQFNSQCEQLEGMREKLIEERMHAQAIMGGAIGKDMLNFVSRVNPDKFGEKKAAQPPLVIQIQSMAPEQVHAEVLSVRGMLDVIDAEDA